jgi:hypothetical protein
MTILAAIVLALASLQVQAAEVESTVGRFVPYAALAVDPADQDAVSTCSVVVEADEAGRPLIILAGYVGVLRGQLLVIGRPHGGAFAVVAAHELIGGLVCEMQALGVDGGGDRPSILVTMPVGMSARHWDGWIVGWAGASTGGGPGRLVIEQSELHDLELMDTRHDGTREIVASVFDYGEPFDGIRTYTVGQTGPIEAWWSCYRECEADVARLTQADGAGIYSLRLVNGTQGGADRVRVSGVRVDGREKLPARSRGSEAEFIDVPLARGLRAGTVVRIRATPTGSHGQLIAVLIRRP